ncbi:T9SS type A sorting domain-containing protein [Prevotella sp. E13-17]|uniref:T9SS type A sorting domain-containing protein n=1 Tax=Prevotella sp. E13-17 TaxID=2913616 RepID=UPI001EDA3858|nr:T9SS type A sorting domain-containing protein [Prevotella sp. E13-17]UKK52257.1 T9SS type A sorting domain-containing protein [Prevotella sp. E13-17]
MRRKLLILFCVTTLSVATPIYAMNMVLEMGVAEQIEDNAPSIIVEGKTVIIQGANGMTMEIVSLTGRPVAQYKIESSSQRVHINNLQKGCYIIKVGKVVRKVTVQ